MQVTGQNYLIPCAPFDAGAFDVKTATNSGFTTVLQKSSLISTTVLFPAKGQDGAYYKPGDVVVVDFEQAKGMAWGKKVYRLGDPPKAAPKEGTLPARDDRLQIILVPAQLVLMRAAKKPEPTRTPSAGA